MKEMFYVGVVVVLVLWLGSNMTNMNADAGSSGQLSERVIAIYQEGRLPMWQQSDVKFLQDAAHPSKGDQRHAAGNAAPSSSGGQ
jgi:hypothetical protein